MTEQNPNMHGGAADMPLTGSTKYAVESDPPRAWPELPLEQRSKGQGKPRNRVANVLGVILFIVACVITTFNEGLAYATIIVCLVVVLCGTVIPRLHGRLRDAKTEEMTTESYGEACILKDVHSKAKHLRIPGTYRGMRIVAVEGGFARRGQYHTVVLPEGLERLAEGLFMGCRNLTQVQLPQRIEEIVPSLLEKCVSLQAIVVPLSVRRIGARAFAGCRQLRDVYLTSAVTDIVPDAFEGCTDMLFHVQEGSEAERFAREHGINYSYK